MLILCFRSPTKKLLKAKTSKKDAAAEKLAVSPRILCEMLTLCSVVELSSDGGESVEPLDKDDSCVLLLPLHIGSVN